MDEKKLRVRLVLIYCVTAAVVLFAVLFSVFMLFAKDAAAQNRETFSALLFAVSDQVRTEKYVSHSALREMEQNRRLLLLLRDNGDRLLYNEHDGEARLALFEKVENMAAAGGYDVSVLPLSADRRTSPIYTFRENGVSYLGAVSILPLKEGYRTVAMLQYAPGSTAEKLPFLAGGYLVCLALLCFVGVRLIDSALLPAVESRKRQTQFVAAASHELRSPLAVISANASAIRENMDGREEAAKGIENECARMSRLIGDMLLLASADAKNWPVQLARTEIDTVVLNVYETQAPRFQREGCRLLLSLPEEPLPAVTADAERLAQVLGILLDNALSHGVTETNRDVELTVRAAGHGAAVTLTDHGRGLTQEQKAHVFERFYKGDAARKEKLHFGLGLSIAWELARLQNGRLTVEDTPGGGCTFCLTL